MSTESSQGVAYGLALSLINTFVVVWTLIQASILDDSIFDLSQIKFQKFIDRDFAEMDTYLAKISVLYTVACSISFIFLLAAFILDFRKRGSILWVSRSVKAHKLCHKYYATGSNVNDFNRQF